jgi:phosphoesterase RecJ-like protein
MAALFMERSDHTKVSFRSKGNFSVDQVARDHFEGGGHRNAAGGNLKASLVESIKKFEELLPGYYNELAANV